MIQIFMRYQLLKMFQSADIIIMKNQSKFIPESISGISNNSIHFQGLNNQNLTEFQSESTDHLVSQILKARAERLMKLAHEEPQPQKMENMQAEDVEFKKSVEKGSVSPIPVHSIGDKQFLTELKRSSDKLKYIQDNSPEVNATVEQEKSKKQMSRLSESKPLHHESKVRTQNQLQMRAQANIEHEKIGIQFYEDKTIQEKKFENKKVVEEEMNENSKQVNEEQNKKMIEQRKVVKLNNQSIEQSYHKDDKSLKMGASIVQDEPASEYLQIENSRKINHKERESSIQLRQPSFQAKKKQEQQDQSRSPEGMNAVESKITNKPDTSLPEIEITHKTNLRKQTDQEVVQAITDRLNQINEIEQAEIIENLSKRRESEKNPSFGLTPKIEQKPIVIQFAVGSQFETEYSEDIRDVKILEHHYESNLHFLEDQLREMVELHEALILEEECIQSRKKLKEKEMENRRYKIQLRNASYSKRFNFHSPIPKNNNIPLQFFKKFNISPNYAGKYYQTVQRITQEKKIQGELQDQYKVFCKFYQLMKNKQISSYPQLPFQLQYNDNLEKFAFKGGFLRSRSPEEKRNTRYQFNKAKRTVDIDQTQIQYFQLLNYKKDISRDAILEFQVFNLGRIKKLKDENKLLIKQIQFVDQQIEEVTKKFKQTIDEPNSDNILGSLHNIKSKTSFSRSPATKTKTFYKLTNYVSPMQRVAQNNKEISNSKNKLRLSTNKDRSVPKLRLTSSKQPRQIKNIKSTTRKHEVIVEIQDDYGLSDLKKQLNKCQQIPTFGQEQMIPNLSGSQNRAKSPSTKKKNFIEINKKLSTRTELNLGEKKEKILIKRLDSEKLSPIKKNTKTQPSICVDQSNGYIGNLI